MSGGLGDLWRQIWNQPAEASGQVQRLSELLALPSHIVRALPRDPRLCYRSYTIAKRDGHSRRIDAPSGALKLLQKRLLRSYLDQHPPSRSAMAFCRGRSVATHARRHVGQALVLTADLVDFFPATSADRVRAWFRRQGWRDEALNVLMRLCVYRGALPQGAPTSPALSNLVNLPMDTELAELAAIHSGCYSRYGDDLAFSWSAPFEPTAFRIEVEALVERYGYHIHAEKGWRAQRAGDEPELTGVRIRGRRLAPTRSALRRLLTLRAQRPRTERLRSQIQGFLGFVKMLSRK